MSVRAMLGDQSLMGSPGKPAPEPRSARRTTELRSAGQPHRLRSGQAWGAAPTRASGNKWQAAKKDLPKRGGTNFFSPRIAVRLMREFQRWSISMYVDM